MCGRPVEERGRLIVQQEGPRTDTHGKHTNTRAHTHAHTLSELQMWGRSSILKEVRILIPGASVSSHWSGLLRDGFHGNSLLPPQRLCKDDFQLLQLHGQGSFSSRGHPHPRSGPQARENSTPGSVLSHTGPTLSPPYPPQTLPVLPHPMQAPDNFERQVWLPPIELTETQREADVHPGLNSFHVERGGNCCL